MNQPNATEGSAEARALAFFRDRYALDDRLLEQVLETALERQIDAADLYFEHTTTDSVSLEEGLVKSGDRHVEQGVGVRALRGERQGYAHSDDISLASAKLAAGTAGAIADDLRPHAPVALRTDASPRDLYPVAMPPTEIPVERKVAWLNEIDRYARARDPRIQQVMASVVCQHKRMLVAASDGTRVADVLPLVRVNVQVIAASGGRREVGYQGAGGPARWKPLVDEAVRIALLNLEAKPCPAGTMDVVLGPGWPGILLHEAIGHGLEGDFNRKRTSAFWDKLGQRVAAPGVTVVDDGTIPGRRGSLNVDDEGTPTRRNVLIENGVLTGYLQDRLNARLMGVAPTGNGRRESYAHLPLPRMTNTFMLAGQDDPGEILRSVKSGLYAVSFGGGQVDITSGKFVFSASEAYRIEDGRIGAPVIGNGPDVLMRVSRIGHDLALDQGVGTCGKDGQGVPVGVGLPTIRVDALTVGGTEG
jgi:TldD protein